MNIYKLQFADKAEALQVLEQEGVLIPTQEEGFTYGQGVQAVVEIGTICLEPGVTDEEGNVLTEPVYATGYHYDVMAIQDIDFGSFTITPKNPKHAFAGFESAPIVPVIEE